MKDVAASGVLPDFQPEAALFDFELCQVVLAHEIENLFELVEIHQEGIERIEN